MLNYRKNLIKTFSFNFLVYSIPLAWLMVFFLIPLLIIFFYSLGENKGIIDIEMNWNWNNYQKLFNLIYLKIFFKSLIFAFITTFICLIIGTIISLYLFSINHYGKIFFLFLLTLPFWTNMLIRTYALITILRIKGYVNLFLEKMNNLLDNLFAFFQLGDFFSNFTPWEILYTNYAVIIGLVYIYLPFMIFPIFSALDKIEPSYLEASFDLGANHWQTFFHIILPLIKNGVKNGIIITFIPILGSFLIPDLLGGKNSSMIANLIERQFKGANDWPLGSALSFTLVLSTFLIILLLGWVKAKNTQRKKLSSLVLEKGNN